MNHKGCVKCKGCPKNCWVHWTLVDGNYIYKECTYPG